MWIDCVHQLLKQHPTAFQYNEKFLVCVLDNLYSGKSGTFYGNCKNERDGWKGRSFSVWELAYESGLEQFENKNYVDREALVGVRPEAELTVNCNPKNLVFFGSYFNRFDSSLLDYDFPPKTFF